MTTLVTGARGQIGRAVLTTLHARGLPVRAASKDPSALDLPAGIEATTLPEDLESLTAALKDVRQVFLYANPAAAGTFAQAAAAAGVEHVVLLSSSAVNDPNAAANPIGASHLAVENALAAVNLATTTLRPGGFDSNAFGWIAAVSAGEPIQHAYPDAALAMIHPLDIADIAVAALTGDELRGRTVTLTGPAAISFRAQIGHLAEAVGREIPITTITPAEAEAQMSGTMPPYIVNALLQTWARTTDQPETPADTTETLLGVPARTFAQWARENAPAFGAA
ncbi:NAD(P)H-binding protein [Nocardia tengchongensis]|uniref:NAD(P)H-binding protein n=1 Tax=Nocardia tengchongensis TaxID=2055889 RepID=A0ABX8CMQ6_9NOCA|nr:NAD(P)H-binding protein [Nocardia tengchongensis]QVI21236.1 NAD(P)H-binding protein [Nocardia tengchongensis]